MSDEKLPPGKLIGYLREKKSLWFIAAAMIIGAALMLFGGRDFSDYGSDSGIERRVKTLCEQVGGVSEASVMVRLDTEGNVKGIAVVCSGGDEPEVKLKLTKMLCALFGIGSESVSIIGGA